MPEVQLNVFETEQTLTAQYLAGSSDTLVVLFHGAIDRETRTTPHFSGFLTEVDGAHQLSIPDPGLEEFKTLPTCWYLGKKGQNFVENLSDEIIRFSKKVGAKRRIYVGGSSGGFAALMYGAHDKGSIVVAYNAQNNLLDHVYPDATHAFFNQAWGTTEDVIPQTDEVSFDLTPLYEEVKPAAIVYLQSSADFPHVTKQALPFLNALPESYARRLVVDLSFDGVHGHGGSVRRETVRRWVSACTRSLAGGGVNATQILDAKYAIDYEAATAQQRVSSGANNIGKGEFAVANLRMAARISKELLKVSQT